MIDGPLQAALVAAGAAAAAHACDPWWVIGSAAVALHGADPGHVADVDLLTSTRDAVTLLAAAGVAPDGTSDQSRFRSVYGRWPVRSREIEVLGGLEIFTVQGWQAVRPATRVPVQCGPATLYIPERGDLIAILKLFRRDKDLARAAALATIGTTSISG